MWGNFLQDFELFKGRYHFQFNIFAQSISLFLIFWKIFITFEKTNDI